MKKLSVEFKIVLLSIIIMAVVVFSGFLAHRSLNQIVDSIHMAARPNKDLMVLKEISTELSELENNVRIFVLTGNEDYVAEHEYLRHSIQDRLLFLTLQHENHEIEKELLDSVEYLVHSKLDVWDDILSLHVSKSDHKESFLNIYETLEMQTIDTVLVDQEQRGFLRRIFSRSDTVPKYRVVERDVEKEQIKEIVQNVELNLLEQNKELQLKETELIRKNLSLTGKLLALIARLEHNENSLLTTKTAEADNMASTTYRRIFVFSITSVLLILLIIFTFFNHLSKARAYQLMLQKAKTEAELLSQAKEKFVANVSHELRTPVNAICGLAEQAKSQPGHSEELLNNLLTASVHLKNIVNQVLDFSKINASKILLEKMDFSPSVLFSEVISMHSIDAQNKNIDFKYVNLSPLPGALLGDPMRLKQILINLIGNAIKFTDTGAVTVEADSEMVNGGCKLKVKIADTGIGISKDNLKSIFDEFSQAHNSNSGQYGGTGLGLSIARSLIELQGGEITLNSKLGVGTEIDFFIPFLQGDSQNILNVTHGVSHIPEIFSKLSVLVIDDEEYNRFLMASILQKWGVKFQTVASGSEGIALCRKQIFDIVFTDLRMPVLNGFETTVEIMKIYPDVCIIATSASSVKDEYLLCFRIGMSGYLQKPFSERELYTEIIKAFKIDTAKTEMMAIELKPEINLSELQRQANGDEAFYHEMIAIFISSTESSLSKIKKGTNNSDWNMVMEAAHKMAAPCKHLQSMHLYELVKQLEKSAKNNSDPALIVSLSSQIENNLQNLNRYLRSIIRK